jgi:hypothetical protein
MPTLTRKMVLPLVMTGASARRSEPVEASFKASDKVRAKNLNPATHTRLPRYVRGKTGTVEFDHGVFATPETQAHGQGEHPQYVYSVCFTAAELWGQGAPHNDKLSLDLWDEHLEKVSQ